jgi:nucleotide-binding universal stress UspA family protein
LAAVAVITAYYARRLDVTNATTVVLSFLMVVLLEELRSRLREGRPTERPDRIASADSDALIQNIKLAETLGATVVRVEAGKPADGFIAFAQREGITHVIFGESARSRWECCSRVRRLTAFSVRCGTLRSRSCDALMSPRPKLYFLAIQSP